LAESQLADQLLAEVVLGPAAEEPVVILAVTGGIGPVAVLIE
jgi:hypothetical protein